LNEWLSSPQTGQSEPGKVSGGDRSGITREGKAQNVRIARPVSTSHSGRYGIVFVAKVMVRKLACSHWLIELRVNCGVKDNEVGIVVARVQRMSPEICFLIPRRRDKASSLASELGRRPFISEKVKRARALDRIDEILGAATAS
jgi:hypothetical protein